MANGIEVAVDEKTFDGLMNLWGDQLNGKEGKHSKNIVSLDIFIGAMVEDQEGDQEEKKP